MKTIIATALLAAFSTGLLASDVRTYAQKSSGLTGAERICINRCEARGWPGGLRCFDDCMKQWR